VFSFIFDNEDTTVLQLRHEIRIKNPDASGSRNELTCLATFLIQNSTLSFRLSSIWAHLNSSPPSPSLPLKAGTFSGPKKWLRNRKAPPRCFRTSKYICFSNLNPCSNETLVLASGENKHS